MTEEERKILIAVKQKVYPQYIFKYRADNDNTEKIIIDNELWFSSPSDFNDPYDCNIPIMTSTSLANIKSWLISVGVKSENIDENATKLKENPNYMKEAIEKKLSQIGICCFSTMDDNILQWSHYADYHKGICLKFDITEDSSCFLTPIIVSYRNVMQHYNHFTQKDKLVDYLIKPKFHAWSHESEIRIVKNATQIQNNTNTEKRAFKFKNQALKEVIFGTKTPNYVIEKYKQLCASSNKIDVQFSKMELGTGVHYELIKRQI